jgi:hypothetical protein
VDVLSASLLFMGTQLCSEVLNELRKMEATILGCKRMGKDPLSSLELNFRFVGSPGVWEVSQLVYEYHSQQSSL